MGRTTSGDSGPPHRLLMAPHAHGVLTAAAVTTVTIDPGAQVIRVVNRNAASDIYFTLNGADPSVGDPNSYVVTAVPTAGAATFLELRARTATVKLISAAVGSFSVLTIS